MREIQAEYTDCSQIVFSGSRQKSEELIPKILVLGKDLWEVDVQYFWNQQLKKDGLARRQTKTKPRVQGYKSANSRKEGYLEDTEAKILLYKFLRETHRLLVNY